MPPIATPDAYPGNPGGTLYAGKPTPSGGTTLATLTLVNTSASQQASGFVSPMFGVPLKQGDVPTGTYPQFLVGETACPATIWGVSSWPDGSMKFCAAMIRVPSVVAGSGSLSITVKNGGTAPAASARSTSDLSAADLKVELTGVTNLSGLWTASLNTAVTDATDIVLLGDGQAGKVWRIGGDLKQSGAAHGQMYAWHYVAALQDGSGNLLGLRYLGRLAQPWADVTSPAVAMRTFTAGLKSGATTLRVLQGTQAGEVVGNSITLPHYTSFFTAGADGRWDFVQGGGSQAADCTIRVQHDKTYFSKTRLVPPYDLSLTPTGASEVSYSAHCKGGMSTRQMNTTGERTEIGVIPGWCVRHHLIQTALSEREVRVSGLASGGWMAGMRLSSTRQIIPAVDVQASYTGLGTAQPTWRCFSTPNQVGVTALQEQHLWTYDYEPSHRPSAAYFPYLITGEPQYLDMLVEHGANLILGIPAGGSTWKVGTPIGDGSAGIGSYAGERNATISGTTYKGAGMLMRGDHIRLPAWTTRDVTQAAAIYPDVCPAGTATRLYLRDIVDSTYAAVQAYNNALPQTWRDSGLVLFGFNGTQDTEYENPWGIFYLSNSVCHQASLYPSAALVSFRQHMAKFYSGLHAISDIACITAYRMDAWKGDNTRAESSADLVFQTACTITSSVATNNLTLSDPVVTAVTNGDVFVFDSRMDADKPFAEATNNTRLHAVNTSGTTFQLALTPGGSPVTVTASVTISKVMVRLQNASPLYDFEGGNTSGASYQASMRAAIRHHEACGDTGINAARLAQDANTTQAGTVFTEEPKNAMVPAYPI